MQEDMRHELPREGEELFEDHIGAWLGM